MTEQPGTDRQALESASAAITRACADLDQRDPEGAASFRLQQEQLAEGLRDLRETHGVTVPQTVTVSWSEPPRVEWTLAQLQTDDTPLPVPRPEYRYDSMLDADAFRRLWLGTWSPPGPVQLRIDLNRRTPEGHVPVSYSAPDRPLRRGSHLIVYEPDDGVATTATVMRVYGDWVHLDVDWDDMVDAGQGPTPEHPLAPDVLEQLWRRISGWEGK